LLQNNLFSSLLKIPVGYLNNEKATSETIADGGWLRTGDLAYFDNVGYLYILDRLKDTIKYKGFQVPF
jgi:long-subunit acyl-CoA synthetase (AMP-forming)